ncbi:MAG: aldo/keto reductase [Methanosarcinales archaeon]|jgi:predicted aldo/keto reductase-like oxidoreductase|nr:aldo/keto reductase [Methanosarcinales archaeon]
METRLFKNKEKISLLGFGTMRLPRSAEETYQIDSKTAREMVDDAIKSGVNYFDTAYMYHGGESETFIGGALLKYPRGSYYLATKMPPWMAETKKDLNRIFEEQLQKCKTDYFDFYLIHNLNTENFEISEKLDIYGFLKQKQAENKIRFIGFSFHDGPDVLERILDRHEWDFVQIQLNYLDWTVQNAKRQYEILEKRKIPAIVMEPVRGGSLVTLSEKARNILIGADSDASLASWAIRYAATLPNVLTVLSGMSDMEQLKDNVKTTSPFRPLNESEYETIEKAVKEYQASFEIPCTYCRYCMECPSGVHIPKVFDKYNQFFARGGTDKNEFLAEYSQIGENRQAHNCTKCGACLPKCPQGLDIPKELEKAAAFAAEK